jgi:hypothetical protein
MHAARRHERATKDLAQLVAQVRGLERSVTGNTAVHLSDGEGG